MRPIEYQYDDFIVSTDCSRLDRDVIHRFLTNSYWAGGIPRDVVDRSIDNALCFGVFEKSNQVGFARVISDYARALEVLELSGRIDKLEAQLRKPADEL